ncbi:hypothetical protein PRIPAC_86306 [Pristionchus pacificus]|uniref:Uncharacterized protein n=1 Tax=Pristionchus pacificus TaxID=54126 RepID=A0A2A6BLT5_PRIPA|nr:hypothetical protein PRIPAC_86306 [Pristionchus pacificus]|eukprot:PDM66892.1 hypothetical protein PRIPAC_48309 [Pristionchus pacificus]
MPKLKNDTGIPTAMTTVPLDVFFLVLSIAALVGIYVYKCVHNFRRKREVMTTPPTNLTVINRGPLITRTFFKDSVDRKSIITFMEDDHRTHCGFSSDGSNGADSHGS